MFGAKGKVGLAMELLKRNYQENSPANRERDADMMIIGVEALISMLEEQRQKVWSRLYDQKCEEKDYLSGYIAGLQHSINVAHRAASTPDTGKGRND